MLKSSTISLAIFIAFLLLFDSGRIVGAEINVGFRDNFINPPLGASESSLIEAEIRDVELRSFLSNCGVLSIEKLIPEFELEDTLGVARTGEIVRLTNYSRFFVLKFQNDALADAFLADTRKSQWISIAQKPQRPILCVSIDTARARNLTAGPYPNDPEWPVQWNLHGGSVFNPWGIRMPEAWNLMSGLSRGSVYIGIIDMGIPHAPAYDDNSDLLGRVDGDPYWDFGSCNYDPAVLKPDHGMGVAGIIGATADNGISIAGIDPKCRIHAENNYLTAGGQCVSNYVQEFVNSVFNSIQSGVDIQTISTEWVGYDLLLVETILSDAYKMNVLSVVPAGNENSPVPTCPSMYDQQIMSVGATDDEGLRVAPPGFTWGSNYGPCLDIMAPGSGFPTLSCYNDWREFAGTCAAAPHVAGVASLLLSINPNLYNDDLEGIMESSARERGAAGRDDQYGWGLLDAEQAIKRILPPYSLEHCYASGGGTIHDLGAITMEFVEVPGLAPGYYPSKKIEVTKYIQFGKLYAKTPSVWGRGVPSRGYSPSQRNFGLGYTGVSNVTSSGFTLETYTYHVYNAAGQDCGWHPCEPEAVTWHYTINGIEDISAPAVIVSNSMCGGSYVTNDIMFIRWHVDDEYLQGIRCTVALNLNGGEGIWTPLATGLAVDDAGDGCYVYHVPSGGNLVYSHCLISVIAWDSNHHEGLDETCEFNMEYQIPPGGGGGGPKEPIPIEESSRRSDVPAKSYLGDIYPNPFNPSTQISFGLAKPLEMKLRIYDASGRLVRLLVDGRREAGHHMAIWDGLDNNEVLVPSGIYFCQLRIASFVETKKMVLLR